METLLLQIFSGLNNAIESITSMGSPPTPVYNAFFGGVDPIVVKGVLERIVDGAKISVNGKLRNPSIACVNNQDPTWKFHLAECNLVPNTQAFLNLRGPNYIFLCPHFPSLPTAPTENDCAKLNQARSRLSYSAIGGGTQYTVLLHELVHMYLGQPSLPVEVYDVNPAMSLPPSQSAINPENYAFFVGNIVAGCTDFPRFGRGRRLLSDSTDPDSTTHETALDGAFDQLSTTSDLDPDPLASVALPWRTTGTRSTPSATTSSAPFNPILTS
ncbi:hypothetical protein MMC17_001483 [Xylographa soralifera]|nr:hypothetical protein [Xylographa soralifera]